MPQPTPATPWPIADDLVERLLDFVAGLQDALNELVEELQDALPPEADSDQNDRSST